ncbi:CYTH domain-containing protein [Aureimonas flava]|uniref:CYTH domain-containing protein n=1 Tax=Aureimonas flava TaxID=2320271 RepID=A0A3A1WNX1_9HYPH|nr:CYTH domain-containing protein [Aureimonas flava]RIX97565.1 CYTH domain-containing protein [Aureimonas flava]
MATEIERKFLLRGDGWRGLADGGTAIRQFYLAVREGLTLRVRLREGRPAMITVKTGAGSARGEYEYPIPPADAAELEAARIGLVVEKRRHLVPLGGLTVEIDVFGGALAPLVVAEIELPSPDHPLVLPDWIGTEVTADRRYANAALALKGRPDAREAD